MRVILARSPTLSYVSPIRMLRVPRPGEIGFGLTGGVSTPLNEATQPPLKASTTIGDASLVLKIFVPLAVTLFLLALVLTVVCCLRGPFVWESTARRLRAPKHPTSMQVIHRLNGCRVGDQPYASTTSFLERTKKARKCTPIAI